MNLKTLNIQQSLNNIERIDHTVLAKMYNAYEAIMEANNGRGSTLRGKLSVDRAYSSWVETLTRKWTSLQISVDNGGYYQEWSDPEFAKCVSQIFGDGYGVIQGELASQKSTQKNEDVDSPCYQNTKIEIIDLRPFTKLLVEGARKKNKFYVVPSNVQPLEYSLKEIYMSNAKMNTSFDISWFIGDQQTTYNVDKVWYEGADRIDDHNTKILPGPGGSSTGIIIDHYYFLNHSTGYGKDNHKTITINGQTIEYLDMASTWQTRGAGANNLILDSPIPIRIGGSEYNGAHWGRCTLWVPTSQYTIYQTLYSNDAYSLLGTSNGSKPKEVRSIEDYEYTFPAYKDWWVYPGKTSNLF